MIEAYDWEIAFLAPGTYHYPASAVMKDGNRKVFLQRNVPYSDYFIPTDDSYLIDGPFSRGAGKYERELATGECELVAQAGEYTLYRRVHSQ